MAQPTSPEPLKENLATNKPIAVIDLGSQFTDRILLLLRAQ